MDNIKFVNAQQAKQIYSSKHINRLTPNDPYMGRTAPLTCKRCIFFIFIQQI